MTFMKNIWKSLAALLLGAALLTACGDDSTDPEGHVPAVDVTTKTLEPNATGSAGESGTTRAYIGTVVTAQGFNLDRVSRVTVADVEAEIVEQSIKVLKFRVPALDLEQRDDAYHTDLLVYDADGATVIFRYDYYVTVPVTDAVVAGYSPESGTVGTVVKIEGRNLEQVTEIRFGDAVILSDAFAEVVEGSVSSSVSFAVPAGNYAAGESEIAIKALWGGANEADVTGETPFRMQTPRVDAVEQPANENSAIGDELTLTGEFLDLLSDVRWGDCELIVLEHTAETLAVKFPSSIEATDPVVSAADITAVYGEPAQPLTLAAAWRVDTTPQGPAKPVLSKMEAEDGGADNRFYLGKTVTVTGENMASVEGFLVDGVAAELVGEPNDVEAQFVVPDGVTFTEAAEVSIEALYDGGSKVDFGTATVYPFYYFKGVRVGLGSNSKNTYTEYAAQNAFFYPDLGRVVSTEEWLNKALDSYAASGSNEAVKAGNTLTQSALTAEEYYAVMPYVFFLSNSGNKLSIAGCANTANQLKTHFVYSDAWTALPSTFGTPIVMYQVVLTDWSESVKNGTMTSIAAYDGTLGASGAPGLGTEEKSNTWMKGSVLAVSYSTYTAGAKPASMADVAKLGFMYITDITCADLSAGLANADRDGYIEFDFYWSKQLNE